MYSSEMAPGPTLYHPGGTSARWRLELKQCETCPALDLTDAQEVEFILKHASTTLDTSAKFTKSLTGGGIVAADLALGLVDVLIDANDTTPADGSREWFYVVRVTLESGDILQPFGVAGVYRLDATVPQVDGVLSAGSAVGTIKPVALTPAPLPTYSTIAYVDAGLAGKQPLDADLTAYATAANAAARRALIDAAKTDLSDAASQAALSNFASVIFSRHTWLQSKMLNARAAGVGLGGIALGNSIVEGAGSTGGAGWVPTLSGLLETWAGSGGGSWAFTNLGVGGTNLAEVAAFIAHSGDSQASTDMISRGTLVGYRPAHAVIMGLRNSTSIAPANSITLANYRDLLRATLRQLVRNGIDPIFVTEPPQWSGGTIADTDANFGIWRQEALRICAEEGASVVDAWLHFHNLTLQGVAVRTAYMADDVHPNNAGHALIAQLVFACLLTPAQRGEYPASVGAENLRANAMLCSHYVATSGSTSAVSGAIGASPRTTQNASGHVAYLLASGGSVSFASSLPARGVIILLYGGTATTGTVSVTYGGVSVGSITISDTVTRLGAYYLPISSANSTQWGKLSSFVVTSTGGVAAVAGVIVLGDEQTEAMGAWCNAIESAGWSDATLLNGRFGRANSTVGATATLAFFGNVWSINYDVGPGYGRFSYSIDGGAAVTVDCYAASATVLGIFVDTLSRGWHTITITLLSRNVSSTGDLVELGRQLVWCAGSFSPNRIQGARSIQPITLVDDWYSAKTIKVLSGTPSLNFIPGASSLNMASVGWAFVEFTKLRGISSAPI